MPEVAWERPCVAGVGEQGHASRLAPEGQVREETPLPVEQATGAPFYLLMLSHSRPFLCEPSPSPSLASQPGVPFPQLLSYPAAVGLPHLCQ